MTRALAAHLILLLGPPQVFLALTGRTREAIERPEPAAIAVIFLGWSVLEASAARHPDRVRAFEPGARLALATGLGVLALGWVALAGAPSRPGLPAPLVLLALGLAGAGAVLRRGAIRALGDRFTSSVVPAGPRVRTGVYGRLRHPSEIGLLLFVGGITLLGRSTAASGIAVVLVGLSLWRIRVEDKLLPSPRSTPREDTRSREARETRAIPDPSSLLGDTEPNRQRFERRLAPKTA